MGELIVKERSDGAGRRGAPTPSEAGRPEQNKTNKTLREAGEGAHGVPSPQGEQQPQSGSVNKPELRPPTERPLPFEPSPTGQEQQTGDLDPKVEMRLRAFAEFKAKGDPKKAERLFKRYRKNSSLIEFFTNGPTPLAYGPHPPGGFRTSSKLDFIHSRGIAQGLGQALQ